MTTIDDETQIVSRHQTSEGVLVYVRLPDGGLQARLHRWNGGQDLLLRDRQHQPTARCA
ncbi:MAG: hypothetical protein ACRDT4_20190 [Micromonosporaceae bacterium]